MRPFARLIRAARIWDYLLSSWPERLGLIAPHAASGTPSRARLELSPLEERLVPAGDIRVNTYTTNIQETPSVATDAAGDYVIVWDSNYQDGSGMGVYAQRYAANGTPQGGEFRVNTYTTGEQDHASVAMDAAGDFVVVWQSYGEDGSAFGVYAQRYAANGTAQGSEFRVNTYTTGSQYAPSVAMDANGDFVVAWTDSGQDGSGFGVYAQRYAANGTAQGSEFRVNTYTPNNQAYPAMAMDAAGDFVVAWLSFGQGGSNYEVYAQRYAANGTAQGSEFLVNTNTTDFKYFPLGVAMDAVGDFIIDWPSYNQDESGFGVYAQRYTANGTTQGGEFQVNTYTTNNQFPVSVAMDAAGDVVAAWGSYGQDGSNNGVYAQRYAVNGTPIGSEFRVNSYTTNSQSDPAVAMDAAGDFVVAWDGEGPGDSAGVFTTGMLSVPPAYVDAPPCGCGPTVLAQTPSAAVSRAGIPTSANPIRYADGAVKLDSTDLSSDGGRPAMGADPELDQRSRILLRPDERDRVGRFSDPAPAPSARDQLARGDRRRPDRVVLRPTDGRLVPGAVRRRRATDLQLRNRHLHVQ